MSLNVYYINDPTQPNAGQIVSYEDGPSIDPSTAPAGQSILSLPEGTDIFNGQPGSEVAVKVNLTTLALELIGAAA